MMKLHYYIGKEEEKIYTLKKEINCQETKEAHYKFLQIQTVKENLQAQDLE